MPDFLERFLIAHPTLRVLCMQSAFIDYLSPEVRKVFVNGMKRWLADHPGRAASAELGVPTATIVSARTGSPHTAEIRLRQGATSRILAGCDWHPTELTLLSSA